MLLRTGILTRLNTGIDHCKKMSETPDSESATPLAFLTMEEPSSLMPANLLRTAEGPHKRKAQAVITTKRMRTPTTAKN